MLQALLARTGRATPSTGAVLAAGLLLAALFGALDVLVAYKLGLVAAVAVPVAAAVMPLILRWPMIGVCLGIVATPLTHEFPVGGFPVTVSEGTFLFTAAAALVGLILSREEREKLSPTLAAFAGVCAVVVLGLTLAEDTLAVTKISLFWTAFLIVAWVVAGSSRREIELALVLIGLTGGVLGALAIAGAGEQQLIAGGQAAAGRATATFSHPNILAFYLVLALPPALVMAGRGASLRRVAMLLCAAAMVGGLMLSLARGGMIGAGASLLVLLRWPAFRRVALVLLLVLATFAAFNLERLEQVREVSLVGDRLGTLTTARGIQANPRIGIWRRTPDIIANHPWFGVGAGNYSIVAPRYGLVGRAGLGYEHAHNVFLTIAAELGMIGLALFTAFVVGVGRAAVRGLRGGPEVFPLALPAMAALAGLMVTGVGEFPFRSNAITATAMVEVGVLLACQRLSSMAPAQDPAAPGADLPALYASSGQLASPR